MRIFILICVFLLTGGLIHLELQNKEREDDVRKLQHQLDRLEVETEAPKGFWEVATKYLNSLPTSTPSVGTKKR